MTDICKVCLKTVKRSDMAIFCDHCGNWIHIKCNSLDKLDYEMLKSTAARGSVQLAHRIFYLSAIDREKPKKQLLHQQIFFTIMNFFI